MQLTFLLELLQSTLLPFLHLVSSPQHIHTKKHLTYIVKSATCTIKIYQFKFQFFYLKDH